MSTEVERVRALLEGIKGRAVQNDTFKAIVETDVSGTAKPDTPAQTPANPAIDVDEKFHNLFAESAEAPFRTKDEVPHRIARTKGTPVVEARWSSHDESSKGRSHNGRVPRETLSWSMRGGIDISGEMIVPRIVAQAFGKDSRVFDNLDRLREFVDELVTRCAKAKIVKMAEARERSSAQMLARLKSDGFDDQVASEAVDWALNNRIVDDVRFADAFVRGKIRSGWGRAQIERSLTHAGVDTSTIPGYPDAFFNDQADFDRALFLLSKKRIPDKTPEQKLARYLINKGYDFNTAFEAAHIRVTEAEASS